MNTTRVLITFLIAIVVLCGLGYLTWVASQVLKAGFIAADNQFLASASPIPSVSPNECEKAMTQADMNDCSAKQLTEATTKLNSFIDQYKTTLDSASLAAFTATQQQWEAYKIGQCQAVGASYVGGSVQPLEISSCQTQLTNQRINDLILLLDPLTTKGLK